MHLAGFLLQQPELFVLHAALATGAVFEVALSLVELPSCFLGASSSSRQPDACSLGVAVGFISLVAGLVLWVGGVLLVSPPHYRLSVSYFFRASVVSFIVSLLWFICSLVASVSFDNTCNAHVGACKRLEGYEVATWMLVACWASTSVWFLLFAHSVWRKHKASKDSKKYSTKKSTADSNGMELATLRSYPPAEVEFDPWTMVDRKSILRSGYLLVRKVPLESSKTPQLWVKRFVVLREGMLTSYASLEKMGAKGESIPLKTGARINDSPSSLQPTEGAWGLEVIGRKERVEFVVLEEGEMEQPNLSPDAEASAEQVGGIEGMPERRSLWLRSLAVAIPSCVFGVPLGLAAARSLRENDIPEPIVVALAWLDEHALDEQGLYRVPGSKTDVESMIEMFDQGRIVTIPEMFFGGNVASLVVQFLRRLPATIFTVSLAHFFEKAAAEGNIPMLKLLLSKLPRPHYCTLRAIIQHLARVAEYSYVNGMTTSNLALCVFSSMALTADVLILHCEEVFNQPEPTLECECAENHLTTCAFFNLKFQSRLDPTLKTPNERASGVDRYRNSMDHKNVGQRERALSGGSQFAQSPSAEQKDDLSRQLEELTLANAQLQRAIQEQRQLEIRETEKRVRQAAEQQKVELEVRALLNQMVTMDQQEQAHHNVAIARLEAEIARLQRANR